MVLHHGRPEDLSSREEREIRTYEYLEKLGIDYDVVDQGKEANTMEECKEVEAVLGAGICKNLFLCNRQQTNFYLLMMPGDKPFKTKELSKQINSARLSFAPEEKMLEYLDILPGSVSVMGLMNDHDRQIQLLVDEDLLKDTYVGCHPCKNTSTMRILSSDVFEKFVPATGHNYMTVQLIGE